MNYNLEALVSSSELKRS